MKAPQGTWKKTEGRFTTGEVLWLGNYAVAKVFYSSFTSRGDDRPYKVEVLLPGIKVRDEANKFKDTDEAKRTAEAVVETWFKRVGEG